VVGDVLSHANSKVGGANELLIGSCWKYWWKECLNLYRVHQCPKRVCSLKW